MAAKALIKAMVIDARRFLMDNDLGIRKGRHQIGFQRIGNLMRR